LHEDYCSEDMVFESGRQMQLDVFLPTLFLAFEYQGRQHYHDHFNLGSHWTYMERDNQKRSTCKERGITLIEIPYWWDLQKDSLAATIHINRPDLIPLPNGISMSQISHGKYASE
jgi:hypothetical protein